jgi:hypothetical protein
MIMNDDSRIVNKLETSLIDDARVVIDDRHMFIVQATDDMLLFLTIEDGNGVLAVCRVTFLH